MTSNKLTMHNVINKCDYSIKRNDNILIFFLNVNCVTIEFERLIWESTKYNKVLSYNAMESLKTPKFDKLFLIFQKNSKSNIFKSNHMFFA